MATQVRIVLVRERLDPARALRAAIASALSQIVDTLIFITISFYGERDIGPLILGQALAKVVLSFVLVPLVIYLIVSIGRRLDAPK